MNTSRAAFEARVAELIEANEALVVSSLRLQEEADTAALALANMSHYEQLREANEQLIVSSLDMHALLDAAEVARVRNADILAVLAHELRTPLTPIRMAVSMIDEARVGDFPKMKAIIERQVVHITRLLVDVLEVSRVGVGKMRLTRQDLDIADIIEQAVQTCEPAMQARSQRLQSDLPAVPVMIHGDPVRLAQVLVNLLDNASKYTPEGGAIELIVTAAGNVLVVTVLDNGIGMTPDTLSTMFDPFVQDPHAVAFNANGLGIGLTVVREVVEAHGGKVVAASRGPGTGSRFTVSLPLGEETLAAKV